MTTTTTHVEDDVLLAYVGDAVYPAPAGRPAAPTCDQIFSAFEAQDDIGLAATGELEPCIVDALSDAISFLLGGSDAARESAKRLARQGDPMGLTDGDGSTADAPETNAPTPERVAGRGEFATVPVAPVAGRDAKSEAWRHIPVVEGMIRRGQIHKDEAAACAEAARRFYRDFVVGHQGTRVTARYGELTGSGGTPVHQQVPRYYTDNRGQQFERPGTEDRRHDAHTAWIRACEVIGIVKCPHTNKPRPSAALYWMQLLICEDYTVATEKTPSLEDCGRAYMGYKSPVQAMAAGAALIKSALERLVVHYGIE